MTIRRGPLLALLLSVLLPLACSAQPDTPPVGDNAGFVYVVSTSDGTITAINPTSQDVVNTFPGGGRTGGIDTSPDGATLYAADSDNSELDIIDAQTTQLIDTFPLGSKPTAVAVSPNGDYIYVLDEIDLTLTVLSAESNSTIRVITLLGVPETIAVAPDNTTVYVGVYDGRSVTGAVVEVDTTKPTVGKQHYLHMKRAVAGLALTSDGRTLFIAEQLGPNTRIQQLDTANHTFGNAFEVAKGNGMADLVLSPDDWTLYAIERETLEEAAVDSVNAVSGAHAGRAVIADNRAAGVYAKDPVRIAISPDGRTLYTSDRDTNTVSVIDAQTMTLTNEIPVPNTPFAITVAP